ncbi:hypothetical protein [Providencia sneebia]|uniref:Xsa-associated protein n=1 Tax=Providencia sneebia DSM 19967 TaxID=1141660 RepID=K8WN04_9GAMM|nr:hypothetical protein [Providencia sneebia]EKT61356.1 xsa-associated protein [Providencia sneebia DSM 19967]
MDKSFNKIDNINQCITIVHPHSNNMVINLLAKKIKQIKPIQASEVKKFIPYDLIGMTISPNVAQNFKDEINFTGTGRIISFNTHVMSEGKIQLLLKNRMESLNKTPQIATHCIRTPGEVIINLASLLEKYRLPNSNKLEIENTLKYIWLEGISHKQKINKIANEIINKTNNSKELHNKINNITSTLEHKKSITKRNDNYYGRLFETELSKYIINNPNANMIDVRNIISEFIIETFNTLPWDKKVKTCIHIADNMYSDPPSWRHNIDLANEFIRNDTPDNFIKMVKYSGEYSTPLLLSIAVKYLITRRKKGIIGAMRRKATKYYYKIIKPQRRTLPTCNLNYHLKNSRYGILLPHQISASSNKLKSGIRPIDKYALPINNITQHDKVALSHERVVGIGMSGSANLLNTLFNALKDNNKHFPIDDAKLAAASWLTYSGGHSYNEAYSVFNSTHSKGFKPLSFNNIAQINQLSEKAVNHAYEKVIKASVKLNYPY